MYALYVMHMYVKNLTQCLTAFHCVNFTHTFHCVLIKLA